MKIARGVALVATVVTAISVGTAPARAEPVPPGCERVPIFGLSPKIRTLCDLPIRTDGSWERYRQFQAPQYVHSSCGGVYYSGGCPAWAHDVIPAWKGEVEIYTVTPDTIPEGEPGHLE